MSEKERLIRMLRSLGEEIGSAGFWDDAKRAEPIVRRHANVMRRLRALGVDPFGVMGRGAGGGT